MSEGIRKINEFLLKNGRTLIVTDAMAEFDNFINGTIYIDENSLIKIKKPGKPSWERLLPKDLFDNKTITFNLLSDFTIGNTQIADNAINGRTIADFEIKADHLDAECITEPKILKGSITNEKIADGTIENLKIKNKTISSSKIADETIDTINIKTGAIDTRLLGDDSITASKIKNREVTSDKIILKGILEGHYSDSSIYNVALSNGCVTSRNIEPSAVDTINIKDSAVNSNKILNLSVTTEKIKDFAVTNEKIANYTIKGIKIANGTITSDNILNSSISQTKLDASLNSIINSTVRISNGIVTIPAATSITSNLSVGGSIVCTGTVTASKVYNAVYADLAEGYEPGEKLIPGDIVEIKADGKVYKAKGFSKSVVGVISDQYAECYHASEEEIVSESKVAVGLIGKVYVNVEGRIKIGDRIACKENGCGFASMRTSSANIGKAIEEDDRIDKRKILCLIFPN